MDEPTIEAQHLHALMYGDLSICGCGNPENAYALVRDLLALAPYYEGDNWQRAVALVGPPGAVHLVMSALDEAEVLIHGSVMSGAGLTAKGRYMLAAMCTHSWDIVEEAGFPHYPDDCTDACWVDVGVRS